MVHIVQKELTIEEATDSCDYINLRNYVHLLKKKKATENVKRQGTNWKLEAQNQDSNCLWEMGVRK